MVIEVARDLCGLPDADSTEFEPDANAPVIATMAEQVAHVSGDGQLGATMRLGSYPADLATGSLVATLYGRPGRRAASAQRLLVELRRLQR